MIEHAGTHASKFDNKYATFPDMLEKAGYWIGYTGKGWGPGNYRDGGFKRNPAGPVFSSKKKSSGIKGVSSTDYAANFDAFLEQRPDGKPFYFWLGGHEPHRVFEKGIGLKKGKKLSDVDANRLTDEWVMRDQASVFNKCCRVFAPRYRQATLFSFQDRTGSGEKALNLAYEDVRSAFLYFLSNFSDGRPFIIASHSQGSRHADKLMSEEITGRALLSRMVAAYVIGFSVDESNGVPVCEQYNQINCQISWNASTADAALKLAQPGDICVNPLSWETHDELVSAAENLGSVTFASEGEVEHGVADAQCSGGSLFVSEVESERFSSNMPFGPGNYHMYDYSFYYMNIRQNVLDRISEYVTNNSY